MSTEVNNQPDSNEYIGSVRAYIAGFISSLIITLIAYWLVVDRVLDGWSLGITILVLAVLQCYLQLIFFLHLDKSKGPRWRLATFLFTVAIIIVIAGGSLWIMDSLDGRMMHSPQDMIEYMDKETGL